MVSVPEQLINIITEFEGFYNHVYNDGAGVATIGWGTTVYPTGKRVKFGDDNITKEQGKEYLTFDLQNTIHKLSSSIPYWNEMNTNQQSALLSFAYNLGDNFYGNSNFNSITKVLKDKKWSDVPEVMKKYSNPNNLGVHRGLLRRRIAEGDLWNGKGNFAL